MKAMKRTLGGLLVLAGLSAAAGALAQSPASGDERAFVGATWSGGEDRGIAGYENYGGSIIRDGMAISPFRSLSKPSDWIFVSKVEIGRDGNHALWRGLDTIRASARSDESYVAYDCQRESRGVAASRPEPGLVGLVGDDYAVDNGEFGLLRAEWAVQVGADGRLAVVNEPVVCVDDGYGV